MLFSVLWSASFAVTTDKPAALAITFVAGYGLSWRIEEGVFFM